MLCKDVWILANVFWRIGQTPAFLLAVGKADCFGLETIFSYRHFQCRGDAGLLFLKE